MAKIKTRTHTPQPIAPMLEESFSTAVENRVAELNNLLAREGRTTNDPMALALRGIRAALTRDHNVTFERVVAPVASVPAAKAVAPKAPAKAAAPKAATPKAAAPAATETTKVRKARVITEDKLASLQVAGTISESAPYGCDDAGRPLAPYGLKNDGTPMKRRGRTAAPKVEAAPSASASPSEAPTETAEAASADEGNEEPASGETPVDKEDLDDLLAGL